MTSVSSSQGWFPRASRTPPQRSTTFSPSRYAATAAPSSLRSARLRSNSARTASNPAATSPWTTAAHRSTNFLGGAPRGCSAAAQHGQLGRPAGLAPRAAKVARVHHDLVARDERLVAGVQAHVEDALADDDRVLAAADAETVVGLEPVLGDLDAEVLLLAVGNWPIHRWLLVSGECGWRPRRARSRHRRSRRGAARRGGCRSDRRRSTPARPRRGPRTQRRPTRRACARTCRPGAAREAGARARPPGS